MLDVQTLEQRRAESIAPQRLNATLFTVFAALALVIATVGIAGVPSFSVSQRTNEFGIRMTLGADQAKVLKMVLREGATLAALALGIGGVVALVLSRFLSGLLFEIQPRILSRSSASARSWRWWPLRHRLRRHGVQRA